ncbi:hypothetical protein KKH81_03045, partial [Patescibacteria group bacterium]|nr:hypothetical protein [Patescibacteria group bacterium]
MCTLYRSLGYMSILSTQTQYVVNCIEMASDTVQQVKDKLSIVDVVTPYVKLTKAGKYFRGLSPFNKEKTPSFYVN